MNKTMRLACLGGVVLALALVTYVTLRQATTPVTASKSSWAEVDALNSEIMTLAKSSPAHMDLQSLAQRLGELRVDGFAVCAADEITASQYLELAMMVDAMSEQAPEIERMMDNILAQDQGITDCQMRVIATASMGNLNDR